MTTASLTSPEYTMGEIGREAAIALGYDDQGELDVAQPLGELGFDSMMAVNMRNALMELGIDLPLYLLNGGPSVVELSAYVMRMAERDDDSLIQEERIPTRVLATHGGAHAVGTIEQLQQLEVQRAHLRVPPTLHADMTRQLLEAGIGVFVEKPIALSSRQARELERGVVQYIRPRYYTTRNFKLCLHRNFQRKLSYLQ